MNGKLKAVIYARFSCSKQREERIEGQIRVCREYAMYHDIEIVGTYIDRAVSGRTDSRPEFARMMRGSTYKKFNLILVWKFDRFARNHYDSAHHKWILKNSNVKVVSATEYILLF